VQRLADDGVTKLVELGPGSVLTGMAKRIVPNLTFTSVSTPDDLDKLLEVLAGAPAARTTPHGEHLFAHERMIVSPAAGVFALDPRWTGRTTGPLEVGDVLGTIGTVEVRSLFGGMLMGLLAADGERVTASQPIAWLRTT
jgi:[acyl-carrier-protein] S-malonyltransferase